MKTIVPQTPASSQQGVYDIGVEAYIYFYPLVTMDVTHRQSTNSEADKLAGFAPFASSAIVSMYGALYTYTIGR